MIRRALESDLDALLTLCAEHADYEQLPFQISEQTTRWKTLMLGDTPKIFTWVVEIDQQLEGYMTATIDYATWTGQPFVYMDCLYLRADSRGQGIGRNLIQTLQAFSREQNCVEIQWHTPPNNDIGLSFYRSLYATEKPKVRFFFSSQDMKSEELKNAT
jgi:ribosomal protein S18 acetylase RimI-like enzyme